MAAALCGRKKMNIQNQKIQNQEIIIADKDTFNCIGQDTVIKGCNIKLSVPSKSLGIKGVIIDSEITATRELQGFDWLDVKLDGIKFKGKYKNNRFGVFPGMYQYGEIRNCDFSEATLKDTLFLNTNCEGVIFPKWPHVTLFNNDKMAKSIEKLEGNDKVVDFLTFLKDYIRDYSDNKVRLEAMVINAEHIAKEEGFSADEFKDVLALIEGIQY